ncbi:Gfo/Idh/MocA family oxidoreductase [Candidatus Woesearchaeota archaeon]|nr:Gfo/Idh/MocA family oxidoreductase [Candidatus Woesearchaeota archaeon]
MAKLKVGIIGCGKFAYNHLAAIKSRDDVVLAAISDKNEDALRHFSDKAGLHQEDAYTDYHQMLLRGDLNIGAVVTPPSQTFGIAIDCLEHGLHTFLEKPVALSLQDADKLGIAADSASQKSIVAMVDFIYRAEPGFWKLHELVRDGAIGHPISAKFLKMNEVNYDPKFEMSFQSNYFAYKVGPNFMSGSHYVFMVWMLNRLAGPHKVHGFGHKYKDWYLASNDDYNRLNFQDNFSADIGIAWLPTGDRETKTYHHFVEIMGIEGTLRYDPENEVVRLHRPGEEEKAWETPKGSRLKNMWGLLIGSINGNQPELFPDVTVSRSVLDVCIQMNDKISQNTSP